MEQSFFPAHFGFEFYRMICMLQSCVALVQGGFELNEYKKLSSSSYSSYLKCLSPVLYFSYTYSIGWSF